VVFGVGDVLAPVGGLVCVVDLVDREVDHHPVRGGAVPVVLARSDVDAVPGADDQDGLAAALDQADALGGEQALAQRVAVPGRPRTTTPYGQIEPGVVRVVLGELAKVQLTLPAGSQRTRLPLPGPSEDGRSASLGVG
jgi:hypothetical protein